MLLQWLVIVVGSVGLLAFSWKPLHDPQAHGFYRFFAFEAILVAAVLNAPRWLVDPFSARQIASWILLTASGALAIHGFRLLAIVGHPEGYIENTTVIVRRGAYRVIRHPLYASLILLAWGVALKDVNVPSLALAAAATLALYLTARVEEREMLARFGDAYTTYMRSTRRFIPYVF